MPPIEAIFSADKYILTSFKVRFQTFQPFQSFKIEQLERLELIVVTPHQERHHNLRQLLRLFMRDVMTRALHRDDLRVGEKFYPRAAHRLHAIAFGAVDE